MNTPTPRTMGSRVSAAPAMDVQSPVNTPSAMPSFLPSVGVTDDYALTPVATAVNAWNGRVQMPQGMSQNLVAPDQEQGILAQVNSLSIHSLSMMQVSALASDPEVALHRSLGAFLDRIDKSESPQIFRLVSELNTAIKAEDLDGLADKILNGKPSFMDRLLGMFSAKRLTASKNAAFESLQTLVAGKSRKLSTVIDKMEKEVEIEKQKALEEARTLERLKDNYRARFGEFVLATVFLSTMLAKARQELAVIEQGTAKGTYTGQMTLQEAQDKVQALESRALAVEGVMTKLPAEQLVIRQVQTATIQTVQEVSTTTASRFASIKMTLLTLYGAMSVQNLQRTAQQGADLDANLNIVRNKLVTSVATTAANAAGNNRLAQAQQLQEVTKNIRELVAITDKARVDNQAKFDQARSMLSDARNELTTLGAVIRPDQAIQI